MLVTISSVGAGAIGVVALTIFYPDLRIAENGGFRHRSCGTAHAGGGAGHWVTGTVDWHIIASLLAGSLPGIALGSYFAVRIDERALQLLLAATLVVAGKLAYDHVENSLTLVMAFTAHAPR